MPDDYNFEKLFCSYCGKRYFRKPGTVVECCPHCGRKIEAPDAAEIREVKRKLERPYETLIPMTKLLRSEITRGRSGWAGSRQSYWKQEELMPDIAIGRKEIMALLHVSGWKTVKNWKRNYALPLRYLPNGKPMVIASEMRAWMVAYSELKNK